MAEVEEDTMTLRPAVVADVPGIVSLLSGAMHTNIESLSAGLAVALRLGSFPGASSRAGGLVAEIAGALIGAVVVEAVNQKEAMASGRLPFELLRSAPDETEIVHVLALGVAREYRERGVGTELLQGGVRSLSMDSQRVGGTLMMTPAGHEASAGLAESTHFVLLGRLPRYLVPRSRPAPDADARADDGVPAGAAEERFDALVWAMPFRDLALQQYERAADEADGSALLDLSRADLASRKVRPMSPWLQKLLLYYVLPFGFVAFIFAMSYALVLFLPLKRWGLEHLFLPPDHVRSAPPNSGSDGEAPPQYGGDFDL